MKKICTFLLLFILVGILNAQNKFQKTYGGTNTDMGNKVIKVTTGYIIAGYTNNLASGKDIVLISVDANGSILWSNTYGGTRDDEAFDITQTLDGGFILAGSTKSFISTGADSSNAFLLKLSSNGTVLWSKAFGGNNEDVFRSVIQRSDSDFVVTGYTKSFGTGGKDVFVVRTDKNGNIIWSEAIGGSGDDIGNAIKQTTLPYEYIITGSTGSFVTGDIIYFLKLHADGTMAWSRTYNLDQPTPSVLKRIGYDVIENNNHEYLIAGSVGKGSIGDAQAFALKIDTTGNTSIWCYYYTMNSGDGSANSIQLTPSNEYILGGTMGNYYPALIKLNSNGTRQWSNYYVNTFATQGRGSSAVSDGGPGFLLTGFLVPPSSTDTSIILIKTDGNGDSFCNNTATFTGENVENVTITTPASISTAGGISFPIVLTSLSGSIPEITLCSGQGVAENDQPSSIKIFPNPFSSSTLLSIETTSANAKRNLKIYDLFGKLVREEKFSGNEFTIDRGKLISGIYFYQVISENKIIGSGKIIAE